MAPACCYPSCPRPSHVPAQTRRPLRDTSRPALSRHVSRALARCCLCPRPHGSNDSSASPRGRRRARHMTWARASDRQAVAIRVEPHGAIGSDLARRLHRTDGARAAGQHLLAPRTLSPVGARLGLHGGVQGQGHRGARPCRTSSTSSSSSSSSSSRPLTPSPALTPSVSHRTRRRPRLPHAAAGAAALLDGR